LFWLCANIAIVYIMTNCSRHPLYTGVTRSVDRRSAQHKSGFDEATSYTARYQIDRLVYFEKFQYVRDAIGGIVAFVLAVLIPVSIGAAIIHNQLRLQKRSN